MPSAIYYTYIIECIDGTYYTGKTSNLQKRLAQHNGTISGGAKYTKTRRPVILRYYEQHETNKTALQREYQLKQLPRTKKQTLIAAADITGY